MRDEPVGGAHRDAHLYWYSGTPLGELPYSPPGDSNTASSDGARHGKARRRQPRRVYDPAAINGIEPDVDQSHYVCREPGIAPTFARDCGRS